MNQPHSPLKAAINIVVAELKPAESGYTVKLKPLRNLTFDEAALLFSIHFSREADPFYLEVFHKHFNIIITDGEESLVIDWQPLPNAQISMYEVLDMLPDDDEEAVKGKQAMLSEPAQQRLLKIIDQRGYDFGN